MGSISEQTTGDKKMSNIRNLSPEEIQASIADMVFSLCHGNRNRLVAMIGAQYFSYGFTDEGELYINFRFKGSKVANLCRLTICNDDLYRLELWKVRGTSWTVPYDQNGIYAESLKDIFEQTTKLYLSL